MKTVSQSREEFNSTMNPYVAMIVQTEHYPFSDDSFFNKKGLILPIKRILYTPPVWTGIEYMNMTLDFLLHNKKPQKWRAEVIPALDSEKYLICDDACGEGNTFEVAMVRLAENGIRLENIWCISQEGCRGQREPLLDKGHEWHKYHIKEGRLYARLLESTGFDFPSLETFLPA